MSINKNSTNYSTVRHTTILEVREGDAEALAAAEAAAKVEADKIAAVSDAAFQKRIDEAVAAATTGLKTKNDELLGKMNKANERAKLFEGLDPVELKALKDRLDVDEDSKLFAQGKGNSVIEKYTERMRANHLEEMKAEREKTKAADQRAEAYKGSVLDNQIRSVTGGLHKGAVEDALLHARNIFSLDAKGNAVQLDAEGRPVLGKDGTTPFSPAEWIELQKELKSHWFPMGTSGSGAGAARDASGTGKAINRANFDKLPGHEQASLARSGITIID